MPLQVLPPGVTSLSARRPPSFTAPAIDLPDSDQDGYASALASAVLSTDPRNVIAIGDIEPLRAWARAVLGNSWSPNFSIDEVMQANPRIVYKAACLYLQAARWGALPDDLLGVSSPESPGYEWPNAASKLEQRIYTWDLRMVPKPAPAGYLADDVNGAIYLPVIVPAMLLQKNDGVKWRVLNKGGTDRNFTLMSPGGEWKMRGWDFGEWYATNADFAMMLKILGFAVVATAACVTGGVALSAGAGIMAALGAGVEAAQVGLQIDSAVQGFLGACINQDFPGAFNGLLNVVQVGFGVDLKSVAVYQPGIDQLQQIGAQLAPYFAPLVNLGQATGADLLRTVNLIGRDVDQFTQQTKAFLLQLSADTTRTATGMFPDQLMQNVLTMKLDDLGKTAAKIKADYSARAQAAIQSVEAQVPLYLGDWKDRARYLVKKLGHDGAAAQASQIPWFGRSAFDAGTMIGALEQNLAQQTTLDINQLTPSQKRALFLGDISAALEPENLLNAAEFQRQSALVWADWQKLGKIYFP